MPVETERVSKLNSAPERADRKYVLYWAQMNGPNTFTNILWCFGLHDRPWYERPIFGQMRYMSAEGMKRKTNTEAYIREIQHLENTGKDFTESCELHSNCSRDLAAEE